MGCRVSCCNIDTNELLASQSLSDKLSKHDSSTLSQYSNVPQKLRVLAESLLGSHANYLEIEDSLTQWLTQVYSPLASYEIETCVSFQDNSSLSITHTIPAIQGFEALQMFSEAFPSFDEARFLSHVNELKQLRPLGVSFYLVLGHQIDCGMGIERPMNKANLEVFLDEFKLRDRVIHWANSSLINPIATFFSYSALTDCRVASFYVFGGLKPDNYRKAYELFDWFDKSVKQKLSDPDTTSEDAKCEIEVRGGKITRVRCQAASVSNMMKALNSLGIKRTKQMTGFIEMLKPSSLAIDSYLSHTQVTLIGTLT